MVSDGGGQEPRAHLGRSGQVPEAPTYGSATLHHAYKPTHIGDEKLPVGLFLSIHTVQLNTMLSTTMLYKNAFGPQCPIQYNRIPVQLPWGHRGVRV